MHRSIATADALTVAAARARHLAAARPNAERASRDHRTAAPRTLPRDHRIAHVFRTLGRGLVVEYDPA